MQQVWQLKVGLTPTPVLLASAVTVYSSATSVPLQQVCVAITVLVATLQENPLHTFSCSECRSLKLGLHPLLCRWLLQSLFTPHSEHRFPAPSLKEGCRKPVLGVCVYPSTTSVPWFSPGSETYVPASNSYLLATTMHYSVSIREQFQSLCELFAT